MQLPNGPRRSNCAAWALARWVRRGGYLAMRRSRVVHWKLHFLWSKRGVVWWSYVPDRPRHGIAAFMHGPLFHGHIESER